MPSKIRKAFTLLDTALFVTALREIVAVLAYVEEQGDYTRSLDIKNVTYGSFPVPTLEQQVGISDRTEQFVLCFISNCIFAEGVAELDQLIETLENGQGFKVRKELLNCLRGHGSTMDYNTSLAALLAIHRRAIDKKETLSPAQVFELAFQALQIAGQTNNIRVVAKSAFEWLSAKWSFIWEHQRFLLRRPALYEKSIAQARIAEGGSWIDKLVELLQAILPTMGFQNENQLNRILNDIRRENR